MSSIEMNEICKNSNLELAPNNLIKALINRGFTELTPVQKSILDSRFIDRDLRLSSQTGSGKTVAIGFVLAHYIEKKESIRIPQKRAALPTILLIAPTRELAAQLQQELQWLFKPLDAKVAVVTGGTSIQNELRILAQNPPVVVGTPGRLVDHLHRKSLVLSSIKALVLDEADEMLDMGFRDELDAILDHAPRQRRTHLMSATFPEKVISLSHRYQTDAVHIEGTALGCANEDIKHIGHCIKKSEKISALINILLMTPEDLTLVFVRTRESSSLLAEELIKMGFSANSLSGDLSQKQRNSALNALRSGQVKILVATDVAARGLDILDITRVIHFDIPENSQAFTHRSGRTGRAGRKGTSILLVTHHEKRRSEYMSHKAGIKISWKTVPNAQSIEDSAQERLIKALTTTETEHDRLLRNVAKKLLAEQEPIELVAKLLDKMKYLGPCKACEIKLPKVSFRKTEKDRRKNSSHNKRQNTSKSKNKASHRRSPIAQIRRKKSSRQLPKACSK